MNTIKIKSSVFGTLFFMGCLLSLYSCKEAKDDIKPENPSLEVSATEIQVESVMSEQTLEITTNQTWEVLCAEQWCTVTPNKGEGSAKLRIVVQANSNLAEPRTATIEVKTPTLTKTITVIQQLKIDKRRRDSLALHDLYSLLPFETPNAAWDPEKPFNTWVGTKAEIVDGELRATAFNLNDAIFAWDGAPFEYGSTLKPSIGDLDEMKNLNLSYGHIYGTIPAEIGKLTKLQIFKAEENCFEGPLPSTMAALTMMKVMVLQHNYFTGDLPDFIGDWTELEQLNISHNAFSNIPDKFEKLQKLTLLDMSVQCAFNEESGMVPIYPSENKFPTSLTKLKNLATLFMNNINMVGQLPENLGDMEGLVSFSANENKLTGSIPASITSMKNLMNVDLSLNQLTGSIPTNLDGCTRLNSLNLSENGLTGSIPGQLGECEDLRSLMLSRNKLTGTIPANLFKPKMINEISFAYNELEGAIPSEIGGLLFLNQFDAEYNRLTSIPSTINKLTNLEQLQLHGNRLTSLPDMKSVIELRRLDYVDLRDNNIEGPIPAFLGDILKLKIISLSGNRFNGDIPDNLLNHINAGGFFFKQNVCPQQTGFGFNNCPNDDWTDPGVGGGGILN